MKKLGFLFLLSFGVSACASIQETGYLPDYAQLEKAAPHSRVFIAPDYVHQASNTLFISRPELGDAVKLEPYAGRMFADRLQQALGEVLTEQALFTVTDGESTAFRLDTFLPLFDPGSGFLRWFLGFGFGRSDVQAEMKVSEVESGKLIISFAYHRKDGGNSLFGLNVSEMDNDQQMMNAMEEIAKSFAKSLKKKWQP